MTKCSSCKKLEKKIEELLKEIDVVKYTDVVESKTKTCYYYKNKLHRIGAPAIIYATDGYEWYKDGKLHREDGPAIEYVNGDKWWYINGKLHRENGPAIECHTGDKEYYINGEKYTAVEFTNYRENTKLKEKIEMLEKKNVELEQQIKEINGYIDIAQ